jgi:hypothetical protein
MASNRKQLEDALIAAHEAGDTEAADLIATEIKAVPTLAQSNPAEYDTSSPEYQAQYGATSGMSGLQKFMAGAGKSVVDTGRGIKQLVGLGSREQQDEVNRLDADLMSTGAGITGNIAGTLATTMLPAGALSKAGGVAGAIGRGFINPTTIRGAMAGGAAMGALQPVGTDQSRLANIGIGAGVSGAGQAVIKTAQAVAQPIKNALSDVDKRAVDLLMRAGVPLDAAQKSGSQRAMQAKRFLTDNPLTGSGQVAQAEKTATGFTQAALKEIGESADVADEQVLANATDRIGKVFDRVAANNPINVDNQLLTGLTNISQRSMSELESSQAAVIARQIDEVIDKAASGAIDGKAYQNIKSTLDRISGGGNQQIGFWARQLRSELDDALERSASPADFEALKTARKQYGNLQSIISAVNPDGNVSPAKLYNAMNVKSYGQKKAMATGIRQKELAKLAKAGKRIIPERLPNSGTTPRGALQLLLPGALGAGYGAAQGGDMGDIAAYGAGGIAAPFLLQKAMNNPALSQYLTQGLQGPARNALLGAGSTPGSLVLRGAPTAGLLGLQTQQQ